MSGYRRLLALGLFAASLVVPEAASAQYSNRCFTNMGWCWLPGAAPLGSPCYCGSPYGPQPGRVG